MKLSKAVTAAFVILPPVLANADVNINLDSATATLANSAITLENVDVSGFGKYHVALKWNPATLRFDFSELRQVSATLAGTRSCTKRVSDYSGASADVSVVANGSTNSVTLTILGVSKVYIYSASLIKVSQGLNTFENPLASSSSSKYTFNSVSVKQGTTNVSPNTTDIVVLSGFPALFDFSQPFRVSIYPGYVNQDISC